jgi:hypothetical protein
MDPPSAQIAAPTPNPGSAVLELERSNVAFVSNENRNAEYFVETPLPR